MRPARIVVLALLVLVVIGGFSAPVTGRSAAPAERLSDLVPKKLTIEPTSVTLEVQKSVSLLVRGYNETDGEIPVTDIVWSVGQPRAGSFDVTDKASVTFTAGKFAMLDTITVSAWKAGEKKQATIPVTVTPGPVTKLVMSVPEVAVTVGEEVTIAVQGYDTFGNPSKNGVFDWRMNDRTLGVFDSSAGNSVAFVAGHRSGSLVASVKVNGIEAQTKVVVNAGPVVGIRVSPTTIDIEPGDSVAIYAFAHDKFGNEVRQTPQSIIIWGLSRNFARVANATGAITRITVSDYAGSFLSGVGRVTAKIGNFSSSAEVIIRPSFSFWSGLIIVIVGAALVFSTLWKQRIICQECGQAHWSHRVTCRVCGVLLAGTEPAPAAAAPEESADTSPDFAPGSKAEEVFADSGGESDEDAQADALSTEDLVPARSKDTQHKYDPLLDEPGPGEKQ